MALCANCGMQIADGQAFCTQCGAPAPKAPSGGYSARISSPEVYHYRQNRRRRTVLFLILFALLLLVLLAALSAVAKSVDPAAAVLIYVAVMGVTLLLTLISMKKGSASWDGTVTDTRVVQRVQREDDGEFTTERTLYVPVVFIRRADGKNLSIDLPSKELMEYYTVGEPVRKHNGLSYPEKFYKFANVNGCPSCGAVFDARLDVCPKCKMPALR